MKTAIFCPKKPRINQLVLHFDELNVAHFFIQNCYAEQLPKYSPFSWLLWKFGIVELRFVALDGADKRYVEKVLF
jgi:hypothetical protein